MASELAERTCGEPGEGVGTSSKFHFVDLAGSERVGRTGNIGERFKGQLSISNCVKGK